MCCVKGFRFMADQLGSRPRTRSVTHVCSVVSIRARVGKLQSTWILHRRCSEAVLGRAQACASISFQSYIICKAVSRGGRGANHDHFATSSLLIETLRAMSLSKDCRRYSTVTSPQARSCSTSSSANWLVQEEHGQKHSEKGIQPITEQISIIAQYQNTICMFLSFNA